VARQLVGAYQLDVLTDPDRARLDDPAVERQVAAERVPDPAEDLQVLLAGVGINRGNDAAEALRVHADQGIADGQRLTWPGRLGLGWNAADQ